VSRLISSFRPCNSLQPSLGVLRDFCHNEKAFERYDKDTKQTARKMMRMMFAINKDNFDNHQEVTASRVTEALASRS
jgi:hypothetical protein